MIAERVSTLAAVITACAAVTIPAVLDFQQRESLAKNATIEYYHQVFDSAQGQRLEDIATEGEIFYREKWEELLDRNESVSTDQLFREIDKEWRKRLFEMEGDEHNLRKLAVFLLQQADVVYECANFRELFKDTVSDGHEFKWGVLKRDDSARMKRPEDTYLRIIGRFLWSFWSPKPPDFICHRDSVVQLFGRWLADPFWYLRGFLYCDDFLRQNFFDEEGLLDSTSLYRLESVAMAIEQNDLEFRYPNGWPVIMRTKMEADAYEESHPDADAYSFRIEHCQ